MDIDHRPPRDLCAGAASGLLGGLIGAAAMTAFQAGLARVGITSGVRGMPSTERAADRHPCQHLENFRHGLRSASREQDAVDLDQ